MSLNGYNSVLEVTGSFLICFQILKLNLKILGNLKVDNIIVAKFLKVLFKGHNIKYKTVSTILGKTRKSQKHCNSTSVIKKNLLNTVYLLVIQR